MSEEREEIIPFDSPKAAQKINVTGWVSRDGYFYQNDERTARFSGCTHVKCSDCNALVPKTRLICDYCQEKQDTERYAAMDKEEWDGFTPLVLFNTGVYFWSREDIDEYCRQTGAKIESLKLVLCEDVDGPEFDPEDFLLDYLPEGDDVPEGIRQAAILLNQAIVEAGVLSWHQGTTAAIIPETKQTATTTDNKQSTSPTSPGNALSSSDCKGGARNLSPRLQQPLNPRHFVRI